MTYTSKIIELGKNVNLEMMHIPGGTFAMGSPLGKLSSFDDESPQHEVNLAPFWMAKYPTTQAQYQSTMGNNPSYFKGDKRPVEQVSWYDAMEFCDRLSKTLGQTYTLPSESQWEYACRAGTTTPYHFGDTITTNQANYDGSDTYANGTKGDYMQKTTNVGIFLPNNFGLYDMHGNVWEWCLDHYSYNSYRSAPTDGSAWLARMDSNSRVVRGGSWVNNSTACRCAFRLNLNPVDRNIAVGFRVVSL